MGSCPTTISVISQRQPTIRILQRLTNVQMLANTCMCPSVEGWITMQLDECFHYGQSGSDDVLDRWIVYHPSLVWNKPAPRIFQHRFSGIVAATAARSAKSATDSFNGVAPDGVKQAGLAGRGVGLYLRTSIKVGRVGDLDNQFKEVAKEGNESYDAQLIAYQVVEALLSERENKKSEKEANLKDRLVEMLQYQQSLYGGLRPAWVDKAVAYIRGSSAGDDDAAAAADETIKGLTIQSIPASDADDAANSSLLDGVTPAAANPTTKKEPERRKSTGIYLILPGVPPRPPPLEKLEDWLKPPPQLEDWLKPTTTTCNHWENVL
ncbi:hypothetical protein F5X68DRAFT_257566 [Plectosphaerella plurivora]|uniref:Uncharacterized protein n=1 Tax=Plectosphaerella plurivora TaxID=936078 RepID=A0A9P9AH60_9PEZI|nr:hypothetical protein F5X68DRAFT_257566 [Plectosphaerella plurivora]